MAEQVVDHIDQVLQGMTFGGEPVLQYGLPTLDRPFGLALWPLFRYALVQQFGFDPDAFQYQFDTEIPMSTVAQVVTAIITYYVVIFGGRELLKNVRPIKLNWLFKIHNAILTILSGGLLMLFAEQILGPVVRKGIFYGICSSEMWTNKIVFLYYLNYLTKYYELLDTVFLVLRHRPLTFLHTYHHGATALLCFNQLNGNTSVSWVVITLNLAVHVLMYFYYLLSAFGIRPWWKHWVTRFQIIQFIIDLGFCYFASYTYFASHYFEWLPNYGSCAGEESAAIGGCLILTSYLVLFISFYIKVYLTPAAKKAVNKPKAGEAVEAVADSTASAPSVSSSSTEKRKTRSRKA